MNNRLDQQLQRSFQVELDGLEADANELKSRQSIGRALIKRTYVVQTANAFDLSAYAIPAHTAKFITIEVLGDNSQNFPYGVQYSQIFNGGTDSAHRLSDYGINDATGCSYQWAPNSAYRNPNGMEWTLTILTGATAASLYMKVRLLLSCKGTTLNLYL